jgi:hypothetical protein
MSFSFTANVLIAALIRRLIGATQTQLILCSNAPRRRGRVGIETRFDGVAAIATGVGR